MKKTVRGTAWGVALLLIFISWLGWQNHTEYRQSKNTATKHNDIAVALESPNGTPPWNPKAYYLKAYHNGRLVFEHDGHVITVKCLHTPTWLNSPAGTMPAGKGLLMTTEGDCTYIQSWDVGSQYSDEFMLHYPTELRWCPWLGTKTVQTADVFKIEDERRMP